MLKAKVNIQFLKVDRRLITLFKHFFRGKETWTSEMSISVKILVRIASYGPQIDQSHGENRLSHIITFIIHVMLYPRLQDTRTEIMMMIRARIMAKDFVQFTDIAVEISQKPRYVSFALMIIV